MTDLRMDVFERTRENLCATTQADDRRAIWEEFIKDNATRGKMMLFVDLDRKSVGAAMLDERTGSIVYDDDCDKDGVFFKALKDIFGKKEEEKE